MFTFARDRFLRCVLALGASTGVGVAPAMADSVSDAVQVCSACHGEAGIRADPLIPIIWGQNRTYILNQLHDFKTGRRKNDLMSGIVSSLSKTDMEGLATHFAGQKWPVREQKAVSADNAKAANAVLDTINCTACHQETYLGDTVRPRLAGQTEEYLVKSMTDFRSRERGNYIGMSALMRDRSDDDIKAVAQYLAGLKPSTHPERTATKQP